MGISNKSGKVITTVYGASGFIVGVPLLLYAVPAIDEYFWVLCVIAAIFGLGKELFWSLKGPVLAELVPVSDLDRALGTEQTLTGFLMLACPLQGELFDITGEYTWTFVMSGTMATLGGILLLVIAVKRVLFSY